MTLPPKRHLEYYGRVYPSAWKMIDAFRADRGKFLPWWPDWCFCPLAGAFAIVSTEAAKHGINISSPEGLQLINDVGVMGALAAWRVTQGVYRFDPDVYREVIDTPLTGDIPHNILFALPEWCVYVETPGLTVKDQVLRGYFAHLEHDVNTGRKELRLVLDFDQDKIRLLSVALHLGDWPLVRSIELALAEANRHANQVPGQNPASINAPLVADHLKDDYTPLVSLLLYICSVAGEIAAGDRRPGNPRPQKTKRGLRIFPAPRVSVWDVGVRMGAALRKAKETVRSDNIPGPGSEKQRSSPRSHVRRAHWHGYWSGPRDGERKLNLQWMPPILVRGDAGSELPVTIKPVK